MITQTLTTTVTNPRTTTQAIINNYYVQFSFPLNISDGNITNDQIASQLTSTFINALNISSNQINITVTTSTVRVAKSVTAQVRFFSTASQSADNLLTATQTQLANPTSALRQSNLTSQLNETSIGDIKRYYYCSNNVIQESPCTTSSFSTSGTSLSTILLASIIPSVFVLIVLIIVAVLLIQYIRGPSFKPRTSRFDRL